MCSSNIHVLLLAINSLHNSGGPTCGVIPALSLLMDASKRNCLAARWYQNLQSCLIPGMLDISSYVILSLPHNSVNDFVL